MQGRERMDFTDSCTFPTIELSERRGSWTSQKEQSLRPGASVGFANHTPHRGIQS
jgi:hypothetical protein